MWKRILLYSLIFGGVWLFIKNISEIERIASIVEQSTWHWIMLGIICQVAYFLGYAFLYQETFHQVGVETDWQHLFPLTFTTLFVTLLAPFGGAGLALYVDDSIQHGKSGFKTAMGVLLGTFIFLLTFSSILAIGLFVLHRENALQAHEIVASSVVFVIVSTSIFLMWLGARHEQFLHQIFQTIARVYNAAFRRIRPQWQLRQSWLAEHEEYLHVIGRKVIEQPSSLISGILIAFLLHSFQIMSLLCVILAFDQDLSIGMLITAYGMTMLLVMISVVPQGVGLVEGVLTLLLTSFGLELEAALAIMVVYRSTSFGIPACIGFFLLSRLKTFQST